MFCGVAMKIVTVRCTFLLIFSLFQSTTSSPRISPDNELPFTELKGNSSKPATSEGGPALPQDEHPNPKSIVGDAQKHIRRYLMTFQERVSTLRNHLKDLETVIGSEYNHHSVLKSIIETDRSMYEFKKLSLENLPHLTRVKVEKLMQSIENIKTTLFVLIQNHQFQNVPTLGNNTDLNILNMLVEGLAIDLKNMDDNNINSTDRIKFLASTKIGKISILKERIGEHDIPKDLQTRIEKVEQEYAKLITQYKNYIGNFYIYKTILPQSENNTRKHIKLINGWVMALDQDLNYFENHYNKSQINWMDFKISTQMDKITHKIEEIGKQNIPEELQNRVTILQDRVTNFKNDVVSTYKHENNTMVGDKIETHEEHVTHLWKRVDHFEKEFRQILDKQNTSSMQNSSVLSIAITQVSHILYKLRLIKTENIPEDLQNKVDTLEKLLESFRVEATSIIGKSQQYVYDLLARLFGHFEKYKSLAQNEPDLITLTQLRFNASEILLVLNNLGQLDRFPRTLQQKVEVLKENVRYFQKNVTMKINEQKNVKNEEKYIENIFNLIEKRTYHLKNVLRTKHDINSLTLTSVLCDEILSSLQTLERDEHFSDNLKEKCKQLLNDLNNIKKDLQLIIERKVQNSNQTNIIEIEIDESIMKVKIQVKSLEKELAELFKLKDSQQDLLKLFEIYDQAEMILTNVKQLVNIQSLPDDLKLQILILKESVSKLKNYIKIKISVSSEEGQLKNSIETIINLEDKLQLLNNQVNSTEDILTLTKANLGTDNALYILQRLEKDNNVPDILKYKISKLMKNLMDFKVKLKLLLELAVQDVTETPSSPPSANKTQSQVFETILVLEDELQRLKSLADSNQDAAILTQIRKHIHEISLELHQLGRIDYSSSVLNNTIEIFKSNITDLQDSIDTILKQILLNSTTKVTTNEDWNKVNETMINLGNSFDNLTKGVEFKNDILSLTQSILEIDEIAFILQKINKPDDLPEVLKTNVTILEQRVNTFKIYLQNLLEKKTQDLVIGEDKFSNDSKYNNEIKNVEDTIGAIEIALEHLKGHLGSSNDLLSLNQTNMKTDDILHELIKLSEVQSLPETLKIKILTLKDKVRNLMTSLASLIKERTEQEFKIHNMLDNNNEHNMEIGKNITNLENDLENLKKSISNNSDVLTLIKTDIETNKILDNLQILKKENNSSITIKSKIDTLEQDGNDFKIHLQSTINMTMKLFNDNSTNPTKNISIDLLKNAEESITSLGISLQNLTSVITSNPNTSTLTQVDIQTDSILNILHHLRTFGKYSVTLKNKIETLETNLHQFRDKLKLLIKRMATDPNPRQTNQINDHNNEKKIKMIYKFLDNFEDLFENLKKPENLNKNLQVLTQTKMAVDDILYNIQKIEIDDSFPDELKNRIVVLEQGLNSFKSDLSMTIEKLVMDLQSLSSSDDDNIEHIKNTINTLDISFENLKNLTNYKLNFQTLLQVSNQVEEILQELGEIKQIENVPVYLRTQMSTLEEKLIDFKIYIDSEVNIAIHHMNNTQHNQLEIDGLETVDNNIKYIESTFNFLRKFINTKQDLLTLTNKNIETNKILNYLHQLISVQSFPETLKHKIFKMEKTMESFKTLIKLKIESIADQLCDQRTPRESINENLENVEESIDSLETSLEKLKTEMNSTRELLPLTQSLNQADELLQELLQLSRVDKFSDPIKNRIDDVKEKVIKFKRTIGLLITKIMSKNITMKTNNEKDNEIIVNLEKSFETLKYQLSRKQDLLTLRNLNAETDNILEKLHQLQKEDNVSEAMKRKIVQLSQNINIFKEQFKNLFEHAIQNFTTSNEQTPSISESINREDQRNAEDDHPSMEIYMKNLRNIGPQQDILTVVRPKNKVEVSQEVSQLGKTESLPTNRSNRKIYQRSRNHDRPLPENKHFLLERDNFHELPQSTLQQVHDNLSYLEQFIEHQKLLIDSGKDSLLLAKPYVQTDYVLDYLKQLQRQDILPDVMKERILMIEQDIEGFRYNVRQNVERAIQNIVGNKTYRLNTGETQTRVNTIVDFLETVSEHLKNQVYSKQDSPALMRTFNRIDGILKAFKYLEKIERLPLPIQTKIKVVQHSLKDLEKQIKYLLRLPLPSEEPVGLPVDKSDFVQRLDRLEASFEWLQDSVNSGQNPDIDNYANKILRELKQIWNMGGRSDRTSQLFDRVSRFKIYMKSRDESHFIKTVIPQMETPMTNTNVHNFNVITENIKSLEKDLEIIRDQLRFAEDDSVLISIRFRLQQILIKLRDFDTEDIPDSIKNKVIQLENLAQDSMFVIKQKISNKESSLELLDYESEAMEEEIKNVKIFLEILKTVRFDYNEPTMLSHIHHEIVNKINRLERLNTSKIPISLKSKFNILIKALKVYKEKISQSMSKNQNEMNSKNGDSVKVLENNVNNLHNRLKYLNDLLLLEQKPETLTQIKTTIHNILAELQNIQQNQLPEDLKYKILNLSLIGANLEKTVETEIEKTSATSPPFTKNIQPSFQMG
uniref:KASH domain-containing protein n=1 Tax=Graphocephala atropunctata TaxID=36148 RepID=A0A1B6M283_9HEMI